jgi:hypothetical protein
MDEAFKLLYSDIKPRGFNSQLQHVIFSQKGLQWVSNNLNISVAGLFSRSSRH